MKKIIFIVIISFSLFTNCGEENTSLNTIPSVQSKFVLDKNTSKNVKKDWYFGDIQDDSLPGISLEKAYDQILKNKKGKPVTVAIIDMPIDINHEDLKDNIWINTDEIADNNLDDDNNGYIDDINGWNFIGNKQGDINRFAKYEYTRILSKYDSILNNKKEIDSSLSKVYDLALEKYKKQYAYAKEDSAYISMVSNSKQNAESFLRKLLKSNDTEITLEILDSLKLANPKDTILNSNSLILSNFINYGFSKKYIEDYTLKANSRLSKLLNKKFNDREILGDNPKDVKDIYYGNNKVDAHVDFFDHGTLMAGFIAAKRDNTIGIKGVSDNIKLMCLPISSYGNEHDKDIAVAIKYAVDNGAQVINMSIGKEFSLYKEFVFEALKYADKHNVLVVSGAGNSRYNLDQFNYYYPNDNENNQKEVSQNFIKIGASTFNVNEKLAANFTNYGSYDVDIFAPGVKGYSTSALPEKYTVVSGGSSMSAALTSGIAALLYSYFPELKANEVKQILMESGVEYNFDVNVPSSEKEKTQIPFSNLSKTGKIVNAYNALLLAEEYNK